MIVTPEALTEKLYVCRIPEHMHDGLIHYILDGRPVGHFLTAVLTNDLKEACGRADESNKHLLWEYCFFLYNYAPLGCWGSEQAHERWVEGHGFNGLGATA